MLVPRKLDDQRFEDIVQAAVSRLHWLCPEWTDHNPHDPGITLLELWAWYKEMLQFQMDQSPPAITRELLRLSGVSPREPRAAVCAIEQEADAPARLALSRLNNQQGVCFELTEPVPEHRMALEEVKIRQEDQLTDVSGLLDGDLELRPFSFGGKDGSRLQLGLSGGPVEELRLWFDVSPPRGAPRNPFEKGQKPPRQLQWELQGAGVVEPLSDGTHMLSESGYVCLPVPADWPADEFGLRWLSLSQLAGGCEEQPRLHGVSAKRYQAAQQQTRAKSYYFTVSARRKQRVILPDAFAQSAELAVFRRIEKGWEQMEQYRAWVTEAGRVLSVDTRQAVQDDKANLLVVGLDPLRVHDLLFDANGRPGEELYLNLDGQTILPQRFRLLCQTLQLDGSIQPAVWQCVDNLYACGPRDRVFTYDAAREMVCFGNGQYGAVVMPGKGAVMVMDLAVSRCGAGNVPADAGLFFEADRCPVPNGAAVGGCDHESCEEAGERQLRQMQRTRKCLSAADYETQARRTPGLRVAAAKALPGYDPQSPAGTRVPAMVTVVVLPASEEPRPQPDKAFLQAVSRQLARYRMIGIRTQVIGPRYVGIDVVVQLRVEAALEKQEAETALRERLSAQRADFGAVLRRSDMAALLQRLPGVLEVCRLELRGTGAGVYQTTAGDLTFPPDALAVLRHADVELLRV